ncbi:MAG: flagellar type III secretion system pore protein FliP [Kofleriaceae bacterium]
MTEDGVTGAIAIALVAVIPLVVLMLTSFVKVSVVLSLLRNAIGAQDAPSGLVVMGISLVLTFFVMAPVALDMVRAASTEPALDPGTTQPTTPGRGPAGATRGAPPASPTTPAVRGSAGPGSSDEIAPGTGSAAGLGADGRPVGAGAGAVGSGAVGGAGSAAPLEIEAAVRQLVPAKYQPQVDKTARALEPLRGFLTRHADARDRQTFVDVAQRMNRAPEGHELWVLAPAFLTTELREAFAIAVLIFIPFLVIDLVVGLGLAALGLQMTSPQTVSLPLKLLLFVAVDGWRLLIESLLRGYA